MLTRTADQQTADAQEHQAVVKCVKIDLATDLFYCDGLDPVTVGGDTYTPRGLLVPRASIAPQGSASLQVTLDDVDGVIGAVWHTEGGFAEVDVTVTEAAIVDGAWVATRTVAWSCDHCVRMPDGKFVMTLTGEGGLQPRGGPKAADRAVWHLAPEPGQAVRVGATTARL